MNSWYLFFAGVVLASVLAGLVRVFRGPTRADAMLAAQLCGTAGVAVFLLLAHGMDNLFLYDVALALAMVSAVAVVAFVQLICHGREEGGPDGRP